MSLKTSKNHITGDLLMPKATSKAYRDGHDRAFGGSETDKPKPKFDEPSLGVENLREHDYSEDIGCARACGERHCTRCNSIYWGKRGRQLCKVCMTKQLQR